MSVYNTLIAEATCPHCRTTAEIRADFRFGLRDQLEYQLGDHLVWEGKGIRTPGSRPSGGNYSGEAYTECPHCMRDFWLVIVVEADVLVSAETDWDREDYGTAEA